MAYFIKGTQELERNPAQSAASFYWAHRLDPRNADALYGRRVAILLSDPSRLVRYMNDERGLIRSAEIQAIDSLQLRALTMNPFLVHKFDKQLITQWLIRSVTDDMARDGGSANVALASHAVNNYMMDSRSDPFMKGWFAYAEGRFPAAIIEYEKALRRARNKGRLRTDLGRLHYLSGSYPQSLEHFGAALEEFRKEDDREVVFVYESKALIEQSIGAVHEQAGDHAAAREAYGRALTEDLSYYPAHQRLGWLALAAGDTASAVSELALAADAAPHDGVVHMEHGVMLALAGQVEAAEAALRKSVQAEPHFAAPWLVLARVLEMGGKPEAVEAYRAFLARAPRDDQQRAAVEARLAEIAPAATQ
jgi:tetratricopeptide (TPR) repeat protein